MIDFSDIFGEDRHDAPAETGEKFKALKPAYVHELDRGITTTWLCQAFTLPRKRVEQLMVKCPVLRIGQNNARIYDFRVAMGFMVKPRMNLKTYLEGLEPKDLPEQLRSEFWGARLKEQKARQIAGDLWLSSDVVASYGELFKLIKSTMMLWPDSLQENTDLNNEQRDLLDDMVGDLLSQIGDVVLHYTENKHTPSQASEFDVDEDTGDDK
jgi:hypothetical protein